MRIFDDELAQRRAGWKANPQFESHLIHLKQPFEQAYFDHEVAELHKKDSAWRFANDAELWFWHERAPQEERDLYPCVVGFGCTFKGPESRCKPPLNHDRVAVLFPDKPKFLVEGTLSTGFLTAIFAADTRFLMVRDVAVEVTQRQEAPAVATAA